MSTTDLSKEETVESCQPKKLDTPEDAVELSSSKEVSSEDESDSDSDQSEPSDEEFDTGSEPDFSYSEEESEPESDYDDDDDDDMSDFTDWKWGDEGELKHIDFTGIQIPLAIENLNTPSEYFDMFATKEFYNLIISNTNQNGKEIFRQSDGELSVWKDITESEFKVFLGLLYQSGTVQIPSFEEYWKTDILFDFPIFRRNMSRNRFLRILRALCFANNPQEGEPRPNDRLNKIRGLLNFFNKHMDQIYHPGRILTFDEPYVLWRGNLVLRGYVKRSERNNGIKLCTLTEPDGMIQSIVVYAGSDDEELGGKGHSSKVVMKLLEDKLNKGHSLYMDNFYTDVNLSRNLLENGTYVTGQLSKYKKNIPKELLEKKLNKGELAAKYANGVSIQKFKYKQDVLMVTTEHKAELIESTDLRGQPEIKPKSIDQYNKHMCGKEKVDEILSYYSCERKTMMKWYIRLGIHVLECMLVNAFILYNKNSNKTRKFLSFRTKIIEYLLSHGGKEVNKHASKRKPSDHSPQTSKKATKDE